MPLDTSKAIKAKDIVDARDEVYTITLPYIILTDTAYSGRFNNLIEALEILAYAGFEVVNFTGDVTSVVVMLKNLNFKRKNDTLS